MGKVDEFNLGVGQGFQITRSDVIKIGGSASLIHRRVKAGRWQVRQAGVYQIDRRPQSWEETLWSAVLAGGEGALVSHRTALLFWKLDGLSAAPLEVTVRFGSLPMPSGVVVHRTRRVRDREIVARIPVTSVPRTLLDCSPLLPPVTLTKAVDSAVRTGLASLNELVDFVEERGGRGVKGTRRLRGVLSLFSQDHGTGSPAESEAYFHIQHSALPPPVLQRAFTTRTGRRAVPDFYWPGHNKAVEVDGLDAHRSADALDDDLQRQNELLELGIELRRYSARQVRQDPKSFIADIHRFLSGD
jgi:very-short-patch-repair endonuclease